LVVRLAKDARKTRLIIGAGAVAVLIVCTASTRKQVSYWKDNETLYNHALEVAKDNPIVLGNLGSALVEQGRYAEAELCFAEALRLKSGYAEAEANWGFALAMQGMIDEATAHYRHSLEIKPNNERAHFLLGSALVFQGKRDEAMAEYRAALAINPDWAAALNDLAWILATDSSEAVRNGQEAVRMAERACQTTRYREPQFLGTLAAAYAEAGRFDDAVKTGEQARALANSMGNAGLAKRNEQLIQLYRAGKAYHEELPLKR
jgi:tetratricopeptide (TPR) repeat protein